MTTPFAEQVAALRPQLLRMARQRLRNFTWAEDAVSETVVAALENPGAFARQAQLRTWLVGILKHKVVDQIRRHTRECQGGAFDDADIELAERHAAAERNDPGEAHSPWGDPQECLSRRQFIAQLDKCLKALPPQQERAFMLRNWAGADTPDICTELGVTANNLAVMLHRARSRLRAAMPAYGAPPSTRARVQAQA